MIHEQPILLVEDDVVGVMTVKRAFKQRKVTNPLYTAGNGIEALELLRETTRENAELQRPGLILLDLNMPLMNGIELLGHLRREPALQTIPVVVMTTSRNDRDLDACYRLGIAGYIVKPVRYPKFVDAIKTLNDYFTLCHVPQGSPD
ncbi:MAG: response regulator [Myxococcales bacterium]|nr:response regulator [Myxococcales bacterium]MCB9751307.1 response regulator [Myxococcales bacterium]